MELDVEQYRRLNSSFRKKFVFRMGDSAGFFSEYNNLVLAIHYCLVHKIRFIMNSKEANFTERDGWPEFFLPFCEEYNHDILLKYNYRQKPLYRTRFDRYRYNIYKKIYKINDFTYNLFERIRSEQNIYDVYHIPDLNLSGSLLENCRAIHKMIWRYQPNIKSDIDKLKAKIHFQTPYVGLHIRSGDKLSEHPLLDIEIYIQKAVEKSNLRNAFILTDDYRVLQLLRQKYPDWDFQTLCREDETGYVHIDFLKKQKSEQKEDLIKLFASMDLLEEADLFIGTYSSNPGMNMGYRMDSASIAGVDFDQWVIW